MASLTILKPPFFMAIRERYSSKNKKLLSSNNDNNSNYLSPLPISSATKQQDYLLQSLLLHPGVSSNSGSNKGTLMEEISKTLTEASSQRSKMTLIDSVQRLGVGHHFGDEMVTELQGFCGGNLYETGLFFRLMRHHALPANSDMFDKFMDENGKFDESLIKDTHGLLSFHEASQLCTKHEDKLLKAMRFAKSRLELSMPFMPPGLRANVAKALELPRHLRMVLLEARNYIGEYSQESDHNPSLLELAKLELNELQTLHRIELVEIVRWWKNLGLVERLDFARDRPFECYLWSVGIFPETRNSSIRIELTKTICILLVIDDIYDNFGSFDDLVMFNDAIKRWEISAIEELPEYMKICYMALYNTTHEIALRVLKDHGICVASHLKRTWIDIFEAFLTEAQWLNRKYIPTLDQYLKTGVTSGGSYMALVHSFFLIGQGVTHETVSMLQPYPKIFTCSGKILRLWDDLGTAKEEQERGDVAKSIECYMKQNNVDSEDEARKRIKELIGSLWLELNGHFLKSPNELPNSINKACFNLARTAQVIYQHGDDHSLFTVDDQVTSLFFQPLPMMFEKRRS